MEAPEDLPQDPRQDVAEPAEAPAAVLQLAEEALFANLRRRRHGLEVGEGGVLDEGVLDGDLVPAGVVGRGGARRRGRGRGEEVAEAGVRDGLEGDHLDVGDFELGGGGEAVVVEEGVIEGGGLVGLGSYGRIH